MPELLRLLSRKHVRDKHISGDPSLSGPWVGLAHRVPVGPRFGSARQSWPAYERIGRLVSERSSCRALPLPNGVPLCPESAVACSPNFCSVARHESVSSVRCRSGGGSATCYGMLPPAIGNTPDYFDRVWFRRTSWDRSWSFGPTRAHFDWSSCGGKCRCLDESMTSTT